jgi:hypothetical protein
MGLNYPLTLFEDLQDLPPSAVLRDLAEEYNDRISCSLPFISRLPSLAHSQMDEPSEAMLTKALLGAATSGDLHLRSWTNSLWNVCDYLITGTLEVDNSLGRSLEYLALVWASLFVTVAMNKRSNRSLEADLDRGPSLLPMGACRPTQIHGAAPISWLGMSKL